ncbi:MAG: RNA 2',3'-cyclic phosphodiesterase [Phycisphaerae bacterium]
MRCFIALELDEEIKDKLQSAQQLFKGLSGKVGWCSRQQMHLTIKFLGEVGEEALPQVIEGLKAAAREIPPFGFSLEQLGAFPSTGQPRVLWVGIKLCEPLNKLQQLIEQNCTLLGFPPEDRHFTPHLTLGRVKDRIDTKAYRRVLDENKNFTAGIQEVDTVTLFSSQLQPTGAVYMPIVQVPFMERS